MTQPNFKQILPFVVPVTPLSAAKEPSLDEIFQLKPPVPADNDIAFNEIKSNLDTSPADESQKAAALQSTVSPMTVTAVIAALSLIIAGWIFTGYPSREKTEAAQSSLTSTPVIPPSVLNVGDKILLPSANKDISVLKPTEQTTQPVEEPTKLPSSAVAPAAASTINAKDKGQAKAFIARAERIIKETKDIGAARLFLERALILGDQNAAFLLGETYDPIILRSQGTRGISGDAKRARELYEQAAAGGIEEAKQRLIELR